MSDDYYVPGWRAELPLDPDNRPAWEDRVPMCTLEDCPTYDGKRCAATGFRPSDICEPAVRAMGEWIAVHRVEYAERVEEALQAQRDLAYQEECVRQAHAITAHVRSLHQAARRNGVVFGLRMAACRCDDDMDALHIVHLADEVEAGRVAVDGAAIQNETAGETAGTPGHSVGAPPQVRGIVEAGDRDDVAWPEDDDG